MQLKNLSLMILIIVISVVSSYYFFVMYRQVKDVEDFCLSLKIGDPAPDEWRVHRRFIHLVPGLREEKWNSSEVAFSVTAPNLPPWQELVGCSCWYDKGIITNIDLWEADGI